MSDTFVRATQIAFIDANVSDRDTLISGINPDTQVVVLDPNTDGVQQITQALTGGNYSAVHIISHGSPGSLQLGTAQLNSHSLATSYSASVQNWRDSLTPDADILLYGCNVADLTTNSLIQQLSQLTGADVAASNDLTGSAALGGDWDLEVNNGLIEAPLAFQLGVMEAYNAVLGTLTVNSTADNTTSGDGLVTLREAIIAANNDTTTDFGQTGSGADTIVLSIGSTYNISSIAETDGNWGNTGLPIITSNITINGNGATIAGDNNDLRIFRVNTGGNLTLNNLTVKNARVKTGSFGGDAGALLNDAGGVVTIRNSTFTNNQARDDGGAILNFRGTITIENSTISNNTASGAASPNGGAIENDAGSLANTTYLTIINSTISGNTSSGDGGGIRNRNQANLTLTNSTIAFNSSTAGSGGGVFNGSGSTANLSNTLIIGNTASSNVDVSGTFNGNSNNLIGNVGTSTGFSGSDLTGYTAANVLDSNLANYGGSTQTYALLPGSPAIDAGTTASATDQRGITRPVNGTADIGAFESQGFTVTITGGNNQNTTVDTNFTNPLNLTVSSAFGEPVNGGQITYTPPASGASATLSSNTVTISGGTASVTAKANGTSGTYNVTAGGKGIATSASYTLTNDPLTVSIDNPTITEGTGGTKNLTFTISLSGATTSPVSVDYTTVDVTAKAGTDYTNTTGTVNFPAGGATTQTINIPITTDNINEADETFQVQLSNAVNATISTTAGTGTGTITNDDTPTVSITPASVAEGTGAGTTTANFIVSLSNPTDTPVTVNYSTANGTANSTTDYTAATGTLTFNNLSGTSQNIAVNITRDDIYELDETFTVNLTNTGASNATASATGTITNDDSLPEISIGDVTVTEGNSGTSKATFTVKLSNASSQAITVNYATSDGTATTGNSDYTAVSSTTLTFAAGETEKTIDVTINGDTTFETDETFNVNLSGATNATIADNQGVGTITNDDTQPAISINDVTVTEGNSGTTNATFTVSLSNASSQPITVNYATSDATATTADNDYTAITSTPITFNAGETSKTITVAVNGDTKFESNETFNVDLTGATNATIADNKGIGTITNDDTQPTISINDVTVTEGNSATSKATFTVKLSEASSQVITVSYATSDATATTGDSDYTAISSTPITFAVGETEKTIDVTVNGDNKFETDETFNVDLTGATNATIADNKGVGTITNDDTQPTISINDVTVTEGNSGTSKATFTVKLSNASSQAVTVNYATSDATATTGDSDYTAIPSTPITFAAGETEKTIDVTVNGDTTFETDETFNVNLTSPTNATIADNQGVGTITNDDTQPTISINDVTVTEGNSGTTNATFTVSLSNASSQPITVNYATSDATATTADNDYTAITSTPITFNAGETSKTITVAVNGDTKFESNETFNVDLTGATNATIADNKGIGTITNDDTQPTISIGDVTITEGNSGTTKATFTVKLSNASSQAVTVNYATSDATATVADNDYTAIPSTSLTFAAGETEKTIDVTVNGDNKFETNETFNVNLTSPTNATIADNQGVGTITNDDTQPTISINDVTVTEGNSGTSKATFTVKLSEASSQAITVNYATSDATATTGDSDYTAISSTPITFAVGETEKTIDVTVNGDNKFETDETFNVDLTGATNATIADNKGVGTITNDDTQPTISINDVTIAEGNSGTSKATFTVKLSNASSQAVTVNYATSDGTATTGDSDYTAISSTSLTFAAGETEKTIDVLVNGDTKFETDETFNVDLTGATNATIADNKGVGTITNDDTQPTISIGDVTIAEGNSGTSKATFTVKLSNASSQAVTVNYATSDATATTGDSDYTAIPSTSLTFAAGETEKTIDVLVNGDTKFETDETFNVDLTGATNATIADNQGVGTITNDDTQPTISIDDVTVNEGNSGTTNATFTVTLSSASSETVTVNYATADGTAKATDSDYTSIPTNTLTFAPGETKKTFDVAITGDNIFEADETFNVNLSGETNATIADGTGVGTITNDDAEPTISIGDVTIAEGNSGTTKATFTVKLSNASSEVVTVNYATADGTATVADSDYTAIPSTSITFAAGETEKTIDVTVNGDTKFETDETFNVDLTGATNATIADNKGVGTITNDDNQPTISIGDVTITEGNSGTSKATFTVKLSNASSQAVTVNYATSDGTATTGDSDYTAIPSTSLTFAAGETEKTIDVTVNGDNKFETDETFNVDLTGATNATIADGTGVGTITNDDSKPTLSISPTNITNPEGNSGTTAYTYNVTLSNASNQTVTVNYSTNDGTATVADNDYADNDGNLTFNPGDPLTKTITVNVNGDSKFESDENFTVKLNSATNADLGATTEATGTITNEDTQPTVSISPATITNNEGNSGTTAYTYTVTLSNTTSQTVTVNYSTNDGTATVGDSDYVDNDGTLTFNPGDPLTKTITVNVNGDSKFETDEDFTVRLNSASNAILDTTSQATGTIKNDDSQPTISINDVTRSEGKSGTTNFDFTVTLSNPTSLPVTVSYSTANGTATAGSDYNAVSTTQLTFNPGETTKTISVAVTGDALIESDENFFINLSNPTNATIADNQGVGNITNDDNAPTVSNIDKSGNEDTNITFTATDFTNKFSDVDGDSLSKIQITSLPSNGTLNLNGSNVAVNQEIVAGDLGNLRFTPDANWNGSTSFGWNGFDGGNYGNSAASVNLTVNPVNDPPVLFNFITDKTAAANDLFNYSFPADTFKDIDVGDNLTYTASLINGAPLPSWLFFNPFTRTFVGQPSASDVGTFTLMVKATDNAGASVTNPFNLTVVNTDPDCFCDEIPPTNPNNLPGVSVDQNTTDNNLFGGDGNDTLSGTAVNDGLFGNGGDDSLVGNEGNDNLLGGDGNDTAFGGSERDWIAGNADNDILNGNASSDVLNGNEGNDTIRGGQDNDLVRGGQNDDLIWGDLGDDSLSGDKGNDTVFGSTGNASNNDLNGRDLLFGGDGDDLLNGNAGNDTLFGNIGNDTVRGGLNDDIACGDEGDDALFGDRGNDSLCGEDGNDTLYGGNGSATPVGANGEQDYLCGGIGSDWLFGNEGQDWLNGEEGNDTIIGGKDNDTLYGGAGNDWLAGDLGTDLLTGGSGRDLFAMRFKWENDAIADFQDGQDAIGLGSGLTFQQLAIGQNGNNTIVTIKTTGELLATLNNIQVNQIGQEDFTLI